jgi:hypothetical protein
VMITRGFPELVVKGVFLAVYFISQPSEDSVFMFLLLTGTT